MVSTRKGQHFLTSADSRDLPLSAILGLTEREAFLKALQFRYPETDGEPYCFDPACSRAPALIYRSRQALRCKRCERQFSPTSGTLLQGHRHPYRTLIGAILLFSRATAGVSSITLANDLGIAPKSAHVLTHKFREAMGWELSNEPPLTGKVEIDSCYLGGYVKPLRERWKQPDLRKLRHLTGKVRVVVAARERKGRTLVGVFPSESAAIPWIKQIVASTTKIYVDESAAWHNLHAWYPVKAVKHKREFSALMGVHTNNVESFFSRLRALEDTYRRIAQLCDAYAYEAAWRENHRNLTRLELFEALGALVFQAPKSSKWSGYWQGSVVAGTPALGGAPASTGVAGNF